MSKLLNFIHDAINEPNDNGRCTQLVIVHIASGGVEVPVHTKKVPDKVEASQIADWADLLRKKAKDYAEGIPGAQTFCLQAFHGNSQFPTARQPFVESGYVELDGLATEGPTTKGFMQQMMRHNEAVMARGNEKDRAVTQALLSVIEMLGKERTEIKRENVELFGLAKQLILDKADRTHEHRLQEIAAQQAAEIKAEIVKQLPRLVNTITGSEVIPQSMDDTQTIEDLIDAVSKSADAQTALAGLSKGLPPSLMMRIASRFQQGMAAREREAKTRKPIDEKREDFDGGLQ